MFNFTWGYCPVCKNRVPFLILDSWLRDYYYCPVCGSLPRVRALLTVLENSFPNFEQLIIHETSPSVNFASRMLKRCANYSFSYYYPNQECGTSINNIRCENIENMTFDNNSIDLFISQDVLEHVLNPTKALQEIHRVLKTGGAHVFTVPYYKDRETFTRVVEIPEGIDYIVEPEYHKNPIDRENGSLVVTEWGSNIKSIVDKIGFDTVIHYSKIKERGIDGEFLEVFVSYKQ